MNAVPNWLESDEKNRAKGMNAILRPSATMPKRPMHKFHFYAIIYFGTLVDQGKIELIKIRHIRYVVISHLCTSVLPRAINYKMRCFADQYALLLLI